MLCQSFVSKLLNLSKSSTIFLTFFAISSASTLKTMDFSRDLALINSGTVVPNKNHVETVRMNGQTVEIRPGFPGFITFGPPNESGELPMNEFATHQEAKEWAVQALQVVLAQHRENQPIMRTPGVLRNCASPDYTNIDR